MQDFESKRKALFACLDDASKELKGTALDQQGPDSYTLNALKRLAPDVDTCSTQDDATSPDKALEKLRGKDSIFKKPELPIDKCLKPRITPDYQLNPHKWKKYSLSDADISDKTNTSAALSFLKQIEDQRDNEDPKVSKSEEKITFKKCIKIKRDFMKISEEEVADEDVDKPKLKGSKLIMPEYVIGKKADKNKRKKLSPKKNRQEATKQLNLSHLQDEEDELADDK